MKKALPALLLVLSAGAMPFAQAQYTIKGSGAADSRGAAAPSGAAGASMSGETRSIPIDQVPLSASSLREALARAVWAGNADLARKLLARGADPNGGLLSKAAQDGKTEIARLLLDAGARVDERDGHTRTALMYAAQGGRLEITRMLLAKGANPGARNDYPREFRLHGTSPHLARDNHMSALMYAGQGGHTQIVAALAAAGADVNAESYYDETALMYAAGNGNPHTVRKLLELGADLHASAGSKEKIIESRAFGYSYSGTALQYAVRAKQAAAAKVLVAEYIRRNKRIEDGDAVFHYALSSGDLGLVRTLADRGTGAGKMDYLATAASVSSPEIFRYLLDKVPDGDIRGGRLDPVLIATANGRSLAKVKLVVERGANVNARDARGQNALYYAVYYGTADVVSYLLDKGIEVNVASKKSLGVQGMGDTALALAVQKGNPDIVKELLAKGADVNLKKSGKSGLEVAREIGRTDILLLFASAGAVPPDSAQAYLKGKRIYRLPAKMDTGVQVRSGELLYLANCGTCHRADGNGNSQKLSLRRERLQGKTKPALISALMQGVKGPNYVAMAESQSKMLDAEVAAILAYLNTAWGNNLGHEFQPADVQAMRTAVPTQTQDPLVGTGDKAEAVIHELGKLGYLYSESVFVEAVRHNDRKAVELFLAAGMNPGAKDAKGQTAPFVAAGADNAELLGVLLDSGADMHLKNAPWANGRTVAWAATETCRDKGKAMRVLLDKGLDPKSRLGAWTLLMRASSNGCVETARILIERGADVNVRLQSGHTALKLAKQYGGANVVPVLLAAGATE